MTPIPLGTPSPGELTRLLEVLQTGAEDYLRGRNRTKDVSQYPTRERKQWRMWPSSFGSIPRSDLFVSYARLRCLGSRAARSGKYAVPASPVGVSSRFGDPIQFGCWHNVGFGADSTDSTFLRLAARELPRGRSGFHPYTTDVEIDCPGWIEPSAEKFWPLDDHAFPINRNRQCCYDCQQHGTNTSTGPQPERRSHPYARLSFYISRFL
jgi:hypothetical protein